MKRLGLVLSDATDVDATDGTVVVDAIVIDAITIDAVADCPAGTREFRALFDEHREFVRRVLRRHGLPTRDITDALQDVFLVVHRRWSSYDPSRPVHAWLYGICHHVASTRRRSARRHPELLGVESDHVDSSPSPYDALVLREARAIARRAIDEIPEARRSVYVMTEWEERPMPEIARAMGIPLDTAYSRLRLARRDFERAVTRSAAPTADRAA